METLQFGTILGFALVSCVVAFAWAPLLTHILYRCKVVKGTKIELAGIEAHQQKNNTPVMGGLLVIITVAVITILYNWSRSFTWVPIGVMLFSALLGGIDDLLNVFGNKRRNRSLHQILTLIRIHKDFSMRVWYVITLPWSMFTRLALFLGSHNGKGVYVHEKLILQFVAGAVTAWWIYSKLGEAWHYIAVPFVGDIFVGWLIIPLIIFIVMFTANAVNIADGMDGLAGGMLIPTFGALTLLSWTGGFTEMAVLNSTVMGALIAYTYFNIKPARFMMGDVGSLGLGALLAINALVIGQTVTLFFLAFLFYIEALTVVIQVISRRAFGRRVFRMAPLHHHFELIGWSEEKTIMRFWIIHLAFVILGVWIALN
jgi:phospho-N-acetylmuramoyl-pentapeptide-transferase